MQSREYLVEYVGYIEYIRVPRNKKTLIVLQIICN